MRGRRSIPAGRAGAAGLSLLLVLAAAPRRALSEEADGGPSKLTLPRAVRLVEVETEGGLDDHEVVSAIRAQLEKLRSCYQERAKARPELEGSMRFALRVDSLGKLQEPRLVSSSVEDEELERCARAHATSLKLPSPPLKGDGTLRYALSFSKSTVKGSLAKEVIRAHIRKSIDRFRACYEEELTRHPGLKGRVAVRFVIGPSGTVMSSEVATSTMGSLRVEVCVAAAMRSVTFPAPEGGGVVVVTYPFMFMEDEQ